MTYGRAFVQMKRHSNYTLKRQRPLVSVFKETAKRSLLPPYNLPVTQTSVTTWKSCHRWLYKSLRLRATRVSLYVEKSMDSRGNKEKWNIMNIYIYTQSCLFQFFDWNFLNRTRNELKLIHRSVFFIIIDLFWNGSSRRRIILTWYRFSSRVHYIIFIH